MSAKILNDSGIIDDVVEEPQSNDEDVDISDDLENDLLSESLDQRMRNVIQTCDDIPCTSSTDIRNFRPFDNTIEIVGFVDKVEESKRVGQRNLLIFKFMIDNGDGQRIQVIAWNDEVKRIEAVVKRNLLIHLEGVDGSKPKEGFTTRSTVDLELRIEPHTNINILGKRNHEPTLVVEKPSTSAAKVKELFDVGSSNDYTQVEGFIKLTFVSVSPRNGGQPYGNGSLTDGEYMLRIRIFNFDVDGDHEFKKGDHVRVRGFMRPSANPPFFSVNSIHDIDLIDNEQMRFIDLLKGVTEISVKRKIPTPKLPSPQKKGKSKKKKSST